VLFCSRRDNRVAVGKKIIDYNNDHCVQYAGDKHGDENDLIVFIIIANVVN